MKTYRLKLTALSPIHIGTGEFYEPTNFVIENGYLYEFDQSLFLQILPRNKKVQFNGLVNSNTQNGNELFEKIHKFIIQNKEYAIKVAHNIV